MAWVEPPEMQIEHAIPTPSTAPRSRSAVRALGIMSGRIAPVSLIHPYDQLAITHVPMTHDGIDPQPAEGTSKGEADDHQHRDSGVGDHVDDGRAHIVVAVVRAVVVIVLLELRLGRLASDGHPCEECMRLGISSRLSR